MKEPPPGRPFKDKLDYFAHDVNMRNDEALTYLMAKHKSTLPYAVFNIILESIYGSTEGYYMTFTERAKVLISDRVYLSLNDTLNIINETLNEDLFSKILFDEYNILTSDKIQKRYLRMTDRRKRLIFIKEYLLINPIEHISHKSDLFKSDGIHIITLDQAKTNGINVTLNTNNVTLNADNVKSNTERERERKEKENNIISLSCDEILNSENFEKIPALYAAYLATNEFNRDNEIVKLKARLGTPKIDPDYYNVLIDCLEIAKTFEPVPVPVPRIPKTFDEFKERLTGESYQQQVCASQGFDLESFKAFTLEWIEKRRITNDYNWPTSHIARLLIEDFSKKHNQNGKGHSTNAKRSGKTYRKQEFTGN
jgi:hypothetical protein